ncbi:hypothetical protein GOB91_28815 [Sinorhizobium meliloti]|nr:hypothetical protein CDO23_16795 [Sinorhizobium meliloti]MDW9411010.1 hypothetical protein [Sinorhizobium meliloti]MDW9416776.1 hypothetical protein [Sinorhizobium meliloti]MDW9443364.1 hypothetical protein [Sinorhizobium meliloti]MDW9456241.1 hypothetical protein [Sinorhizobium meliloti]
MGIATSAEPRCAWRASNRPLLMGTRIAAALRSKIDFRRGIAQKPRHETAQGIFLARRRAGGDLGFGARARP